MSKKSNEIVSKVMAKAIKTVFDEMVEKGDMTTCVSSATLAADKRVAKAFTVSHPQTLETLVKAATAGGQIPGLGIRKGRSGGVHRVVVRKAKKAKSVEATSAEVSAAPVAAAA